MDHKKFAEKVAPGREDLAAALEKVLVIGTGLSGKGAVRLLHTLEAQTVLLDQNDKLTEDDVRGRLDPADRDWPEVVVGAYPRQARTGLTLCVPSPAVPMDSPLILELMEDGVPVISEIELAFAFEQGRLIAITGTNGKTTTTTLVGAIMKEAAPAVHVVGNIGNAYAGEVLSTAADSVSVAEVSSFQLEGIRTFHPAVSAILNITPDHLNRHYTMENYAAIKERITVNQGPEDACVLNYADPVLRVFGESACPAHVVWFSTGEVPPEGFWADDDDIYSVSGGQRTRLMGVRDMQLVGRCNVENVMAAMGICGAAGVPMETILAVVHDFPPVEHRIEFAGEVDGVRYYNDSKATNPDAAIQGIRAMDRPTVLIGGGYDKKNDYGEWIDAFDGKVRELVLIGATAQAIAACAREHGFDRISFCETFEECLAHCTAAAEPGDAVLLSPACASWGMFPNYEERGRQFKAYVNRIAGKG